MGLFWLLRSTGGFLMARKPTYEELERRVLELEKEASERKRAEEELIDTDAQLEKMLAASPVAIYRCEPGGDYPATFVSKNVKRQLGYEPHEFTEDPRFWANHIHPEDAPRVFAELSCLFEKGYHAHEYRFLHKDGNYRWMQDELRLARDAEGNPLDIIGNWIDITERKWAEGALRESEERYRSLVESTEDSIYLVDRDCRYLFMNEKHLSRLDLAPEEVIGKTYAEYHSADDTKQFVEKIQEVAETGGSVQHEHRSRRDGRYFLRTLSPVKDLDGRTTSVTVVSKDIDELKRAEEALKRSSERIKLFAYSVAHDLKSPAIGIYGLTKRLHTNFSGILGEKGSDHCDQILKAAEQISALVEQINVYVSTNEAPLSIERVKLKEILRVIKGEFSAQIGIRQIRWSEPEYLPEINADRLSILRVLRNLVDNAVKYGGKDLSEIKIGCKESDRFHVLSVEDDGVGITEEDSEDVFGLFKRKATSGGIEGAGLGLAIVKEIAEKHGGEVWVEPGLRKGVTFNISISKYLPLSQ
jgi:PAS domain S-box-containing protein